MRIHELFLAEATEKKDTLREILGELYLFYDNIYLSDYATASGHLLRAETLAEAAGNDGWQGWIAYRRGTLNLRLRQTDDAIIAHKQAVEQCGLAGDSLCVAENLEQLSAMYALKDNFPLARQYFDRALPMMRRHGKQVQLATAFANFGILLSQEERFEEAIPPLEEALRIQKKLGNRISITKAKNNIALALLRVGKAKEALQMFNECLSYNLEQGFAENAMRNYAGIRESYLAMGNYPMAYDYQSSYINLRDSLLGEDTKVKIAELEAKYYATQQELALQKSQNLLSMARRESERKGTILLIVIFLSISAGWLWWRQTLRSRKKVEENGKNLERVISLLARKNEALIKLRAEADAPNEKSIVSNDQKEQIETINLFNQSILTTADWTDFKVYFDNSYPGYVQRLRSTHPDLSEAEERLFLLIKLNLTTSEISNILGISIGGVKKTRSRLRKRLVLGPEIKLKDFIGKF